MIYFILDWFFVVFHSLLIVFNLFGWIWKPLRKANLATLILTGSSWTILGIFYGLGYCPLTDWHWNVLTKIGQEPSTNTYVAYLFQRVLDIHMPDNYADTITFTAYLVALGFAVAVNIFDQRRNGRKKVDGRKS